MDELREMVKSIGDADAAKLKDLIPKIMNKIKEVGFVKVVRDEELKTFMPKMREKMAEIDVEELIPLANVVMPTFFEGMTELFAASEEAQEELEDMDDMKMQMSSPDLDVYMFITVEDGKLTAGSGKLDDPDVSIIINKETFLKQMQGESDMVSSYMSGDIKIEGEMAKVMALRPLFEVLSDEYDLEMGFGG
ncbi:MAG: SCP2 sterol-binding domain-containing protein [Candidatus Helarchaeota archaeon]|nr:SCP2 sterol-binding domain-containing protein [Candidatus Helarchaeota archaeon]